MPLVMMPVCSSPPPRDFLIFFSRFILSRDPMTAAPMGQQSPLVKQRVIESQQSLISLASRPQVASALNIRAPSMCTATLFSSAIRLIYRSTARSQTCPRKVPFQRKMRSVSGKVTCCVLFLMRYLTEQGDKIPCWGVKSPDSVKIWRVWTPAILAKLADSRQTEWEVEAMMISEPGRVCRRTVARLAIAALTKKMAAYLLNRLAMRCSHRMVSQSSRAESF